MLVKVERVNKQDKNKDGQYLTRKDGTRYWNIGIKVEGQEAWISGFASNEKDPMYNIEEGKEYSITVSEKEVNGKVYKNFKLLSKAEMWQEEAEKRLVALENYCFGIGKNNKEEEINDVPDLENF